MRPPSSGAATLIEFSCAAILIDTGGESNDWSDSTERLEAYLKGFFDRRPDLKYITGSQQARQTSH